MFAAWPLALTFAGAYAVVRAAHIGLHVIASEDDPELRRSVVGFSFGTAAGVALIAVAAVCLTSPSATGSSCSSPSGNRSSP